MTAAGAHREGLWIVGRRIERPEAVLLALIRGAPSAAHEEDGQRESERKEAKQA